MSLKYSLTFAVLSAASVVTWLVVRHAVGWAALPLLCTALSFVLLSIAYAGVGPQLLFKQGSGRRAPWAWALHWPYFLLNAVTFGLYRRLSTEPPFIQVGRNLYFGRRLTAHEAASGPWNHVLDLAGEFAEVKTLRQRPGYRSLPMLDATAPPHVHLQSAVQWINQSVQAGPVYVHCALGHGRSGTVVIAYLLSAGLVATVSEGIQIVQARGPGVRLSPPQQKCLDDFQRNQETG